MYKYKPSHSLNHVLTSLGYTTRKAGKWGQGRDILDSNGEVVLSNVSADQVWNWLRDKGEVV